MVGVLSNQISREELKPGDHIYSWRQAYIYANHGIYAGDGKVIHFTQGASQEKGTGTFLDRMISHSFPAHPVDSPCPQCGDQSRLDGVIRSCLDCFLSGGNLCIFQYSVSRALLFADVWGGTCTLAASDPPEDVLRRAGFLLKNGFGAYQDFEINCELFAIYCKTGLLVLTSSSFGGSGQAETFQAVTGVVTSVFGPRALRFLITRCPGLGRFGQAASFLTATGFLVQVGVHVGKHCRSRYRSDIGVRRDVDEVPVERLVARSGIEPEAAPEMGNKD